MSEEIEVPHTRTTQGILAASPTEPPVPAPPVPDPEPAEPEPEPEPV
jgi:hypothetical protein